MKIHSPTAVRVASFLFSGLVWMLFRTLRLEVRTTDVANPYAASGDRRFLFLVWHDSAVIAAFGGPHVRTVALTSRHRDGSFVAHVARFVKVPTVRGSTGPTGRKALRELLETAHEFDIVMTPDGPRGPSRQMSRGAIFLASRTGSEIVPTAFACSRAWRIPGRWTHLTIPKPFARVVLLAGDPIAVPPRLTAAELEPYLQTVQDAMNQLDDQAGVLIGRNAVPPSSSLGGPNPSVA